MKYISLNHWHRCRLQQYERDSASGAAKKARRDSPPSFGDGNDNTPPGSSMANDQSSDVIKTLTEMEERVNQEMSARYRNSMMATRSESSGEADGSQCTVEDM